MLRYIYSLDIDTKKRSIPPSYNIKAVALVSSSQVGRRTRALCWKFSWVMNLILQEQASIMVLNMFPAPARDLIMIQHKNKP